MSGENNGRGDKEYITIGELIARIDAAVLGMSARNPNRLLMVQCKVAIEHLSRQVPQGETMSRGGIILP